MNRLLRKYNRILLAVFGVGLMIVFLMPQLPDIVQQLGGGGSQIAVMGEDNHQVTRRDWRDVQQQVQILQRLQQLGILQALPVANNLLEDPEQYFLLVHEASEAGMIGGGASAGIDPDFVLRISIQTGLPPAAIRQSLINFTGINRYLDQVVRAGHVSDRRMRLEARRMLDSIDTRFVVMPAEITDDAALPDEATLQAQFDAWADTIPGEGDHGFGYRLPARAAIEWIQVPKATVEAAIRTEFAIDDLEARKYWRNNATRLETPVEASSEVPEKVINAYVNDKVDSRMPVIARAAADRLRAPRRGFASSEGYIVLPDNWSDQRIDLTEVRGDLAEQFALATDEESLPLPASTDGLVDLDAIRGLDGVGRAGTDRFGPAQSGARYRRLADLVSASKEFGGLGQVPVQQGLAGPVLDDLQGNLWVFRLTDTDAARPPAELNEVRDQVIEDARRLARWNAMQVDLADLEATALSEGVAGVASTYDENIRGPQAVKQNFAPGIATPPRVPGLGDDQEVIDAIIARSIELGNEPLRDMPVGDRVVVIPSSRNMAFVVAELDRRVPLTQDAYRRYVQGGTLPLAVMTNELGGRDLSDLSEAFSGDALRARHRFRRAGGDGSEDGSGDTSGDSSEGGDDVADATDALQ